MTGRNNYSINPICRLCIAFIITGFFGCYKSIELPFEKISAPIPLGEYELHNKNEMDGDSYYISVHWVGGPHNTFEICNFLNKRITITAYLQKDNSIRIPNQQVSNVDRQITVFEGDGIFGSSYFEISIWYKENHGDNKSMYGRAELHH